MSNPFWDFESKTKQSTLLFWTLSCSSHTRHLVFFDRTNVVCICTHFFAPKIKSIPNKHVMVWIESSRHGWWYWMHFSRRWKSLSKIWQSWLQTLYWYIGMADGTVFDSSRISDKLFKFVIGRGGFIMRWDVGVKSWMGAKVKTIERKNVCRDCCCYSTNF